MPFTKSGEEEASLEPEKRSEAKEGRKSTQKLGSKLFPGEARKRIANKRGRGGVEAKTEAGEGGRELF